MSKAQGQFTIIDYNDAITLTGFIESNQPKTQRYNPDSNGYMPDWSDTAGGNNMVLTATLFVAGSGTDIFTDNERKNRITSVTWAADGVTIAGTEAAYEISAFGTTKSRQLTIKQNVMGASDPGMEITCTIVYHDPTTGLDLTFTEGISLSLVHSGSGLTDLVCYTPQGNVFKNGEVESLTAKAELWRGSTVETNTTGTNAKAVFHWYEMDPSVNDPNDNTVYKPQAGLGWRFLTDQAGHFSGTGTDTLTVYAAEVDSNSTYMCVCRDKLETSGTYDQLFKDVVSMVDMSDNLTVIISSTGGDIFKNGEGGTTLTAHVYQGGDEIDNVTPYKGSYTWTKYRDSTPADDTEDPVTIDTSWGTNGHKTGKVLTVGGNDVDVKATFVCEVVI